MKAAFLIKEGPPESAFEIRDADKPCPSDSQVLIKVEAFGINFADVMARLGLYKDAPPLPALLGYDVVGEVVECGKQVSHLQPGDRVTALTKFGGYAEYAVAEGYSCQLVPPGISAGAATALATQYCTAYFLSHNMANLMEGDRVLIHAAAGGVGTALVQMALHKNCIVFGTCSSSAKIEYLKSIGVHHPINYVENSFDTQVNEILGDNKLDVVFDPVGGKSVKKGFRLLGAGGRLLLYGVSSLNQTKTIFGKLAVLCQFGIYHPVQFLMHSKGMIGVNMLKIANERPGKFAQAMQSVFQLAQEGVLKPHVGGEFNIDQLGEAHAFLESRKSIGKIVVKW